MIKLGYRYELSDYTIENILLMFYDSILTKIFKDIAMFKHIHAIPKLIVKFEMNSTLRLALLMVELLIDDFIACKTIYTIVFKGDYKTPIRNIKIKLKILPLKSEFFKNTMVNSLKTKYYYRMFKSVDLINLLSNVINKKLLIKKVLRYLYEA